MIEYLIIQVSLYYLSSARGRLREVVAYKRFQI